ncbi:DUF3916 domain-containing protein [Exiguobacterium sp. SH31]|uniref:DUF3916 domain-containing protein n=1 Tax=Exiguobacterium sp. SH31 TaxID=1843183 RepID=UPI00336C0BC0
MRGIRRRLKRLRTYIDEQTYSFPTTFHDGYWHNKIPIDQSFLLSVQENSRIQYAVIEAMMEGPPVSCVSEKRSGTGSSSCWTFRRFGSPNSSCLKMMHD